MGFFDKLSGPPKQHRKSRREERAEQQRSSGGGATSPRGQSQAHRPGYGWSGGPRSSRTFSSPSASQESYGHAQYAQPHQQQSHPQQHSGPLQPQQHSGPLQQQQYYHQQGYQQYQQPPQRQQSAQHQQLQQQQHFYQQQGQPAASPQGTPRAEGGMFSMFKNVLSFAPGRNSSREAEQTPGDYPITMPKPVNRQVSNNIGPQNPPQNPGTTQETGPLNVTLGGSGPTSGGGGADVRNLQHKVSLLESQLQELEELKRQLYAEQRTTTEWREKWNYQNFKLNLMVDMLVLRVLELEGGALPVAEVQRLGASAARASAASSVMSLDPSMAVGRPAAISRNAKHDVEIIEESFDDY